MGIRKALLVREARSRPSCPSEVWDSENSEIVHEVGDNVLYHALSE